MSNKLPLGSVGGVLGYSYSLPSGYHTTTSGFWAALKTTSLTNVEVFVIDQATVVGASIPVGP